MAWSGIYDAIVLAGDMSAMVSGAAVAYREVHARDGFNLEQDDVSTYLASETEWYSARKFLMQMILSICKAYNESRYLLEGMKADSSFSESDVKGIMEWMSQLAHNSTVPVPVTQCWKNTKVRKVSFSNRGATETDKSNPVPDPALLLAKATSNWLRQHNIDILPMYVDDDDDDSCWSDSD